MVCHRSSCTPTATSAATVALRAERVGSGNGRVYTVEFEVADDAGNLTAASCQVTVPKDPGAVAEDDGPAYWVVP